MKQSRVKMFDDNNMLIRDNEFDDIQGALDYIKDKRGHLPIGYRLNLFVCRKRLKGWKQIPLAYDWDGEMFMLDLP